MTLHPAVAAIAGMSAAMIAGCTSFATVRSAEVRPGPSLTTQASVTSPVGPVAGWLWSYDCAADCDHAIPSLDVTLAYGRRREETTPFAVGIGLNGTSGFAEGYVQLRSTERLPFGIGGRVGLPIGPAWENQVYGRLDIPLGPSARLLWNPSVFHTSITSPNGANNGSFLGLVQGIGLEIGSGSVTVTPSVAVVWGRAEYHNPEQHGPENRVFGTGALSMTIGRKVPRNGR
jgi:hypothetical protein